MIRRRWGWGGFVMLCLFLTAEWASEMCAYCYRYLNEALNNVSIKSAAPEKRLKYAKLFAPDLEKELAFLK
jgi:hypothetical protein